MVFTKTMPKYAGESFSVWEGIVENGTNKGDIYLKIRLFGHTTNCFLVKENKAVEEEKKEE